MTIFLSEAAAQRAGLVPKTKKAKAKNARLDIPRAARAAAGEGDRQKDLETLAAAGYTCTNYCHATGAFWMSGAAGTTPRVTSYRQMLDDAMGVQL